MTAWHVRVDGLVGERVAVVHGVGGVDGARVLGELYLVRHGDGCRAAVLLLVTSNVEFAKTLRVFADDEPTDVAVVA